MNIQMWTTIHVLIVEMIDLIINNGGTPMPTEPTDKEVRHCNICKKQWMFKVYGDECPTCQGIGYIGFLTKAEAPIPLEHKMIGLSNYKERQEEEPATNIADIIGIAGDEPTECEHHYVTRSDLKVKYCIHCYNQIQLPEEPAVDVYEGKQLVERMNGSNDPFEVKLTNEEIESQLDRCNEEPSVAPLKITVPQWAQDVVNSEDWRAKCLELEKIIEEKTWALANCETERRITEDEWKAKYDELALTLSTITEMKDNQIRNLSIINKYLKAWLSEGAA